MDSSNHLAMSHDLTLVVISWAVAIFAAFAALNTLDRLRLSDAHRSAWLLGGAVAFGFGVWAMHFTAMTAMGIDRLITYDPALTALSVVFAVAGAWVSFFLITQGSPNILRVLTSGTLLGAGIGAMHYTGMFAMRMNAVLGFNLVMVGVSVVVAVTISSLGLWMMTSERMNNIGGRTLVVSAVVGSAIPLLHYAGMAAARFSPAPGSAGAVINSGMTLSLNLFLVLAILVLSFPLFLSALFPIPEQAGELEAYEV